jgi:hypothetical protein
MSRSSWLCGTLLAAALVLGLTAGRSAADTVFIGAAPTDSCYVPPAVSYYPAPAVSYYAAPAVSYYAAPAVSYYDAPAVSYYAPPTVSYYAAAPTVSYYAPAGPVAVTTVRPGILPRREIVTTRYYASAPAPVVTYAPSEVVVTRPRIARYYSPLYLYP